MAELPTVKDLADKAGIILPKTNMASVRRDGIDVVVLMNGRRVLDVPWDAALMLAKAITIQAKRIEEQVKAPAIIADQALLMRSGAPIGLTSHPVLIDEAKKEALYNPKLRKYLTGKRAGGIGSESIVGKPRLIKHRPRRDNNGLRSNVK